VCTQAVLPVMRQQGAGHLPPATTSAQLQFHGALAKVSDRLTNQVSEQLVAMLPGTIDRMLKPTKATRYLAAKSATRSSATLRGSIGVRQAMDEMEMAPGTSRST